ncbi:GntR family transcriptional regulator [Streptococcus devriesei]|uniref:GntR family transcriptional regulator n=1 Tax=Streptococcus devriesei TaxID=231233 RepID=UPI00048729E8|nr:GntR family transcriptional regulator [Streptococcus devriesei]
MDILISYHSKEPIYEQIVIQIKSKILHGELVAGTTIPPIRVLAKELSVSIITVKKAYEILQSEKLITSVVGKGTVVSGISSQLIRENIEETVESKIRDLISFSKDNGLTEEEIKNICLRIFDERNRS